MPRSSLEKGLELTGVFDVLKHMAQDHKVEFFVCVWNFIAVEKPALRQLSSLLILNGLDAGGRNFKRIQLFTKVKFGQSLED